MLLNLNSKGEDRVTRMCGFQVLTRADKCWSMLTSVDKCWQVLANAKKSRQQLASAYNCWQVVITADKCWQVLTNSKFEKPKVTQFVKGNQSSAKWYAAAKRKTTAVSLQKETEILLSLCSTHTQNNENVKVEWTTYNHNVGLWTFDWT